MSFTKASAALNNCWNAASQGDAKKARTFARTFITYGRKMGAITFNGVPRGLDAWFRAYELTATEIVELHKIAEYEMESKTVEIAVVAKQNTREVCYAAFSKVDMNDSAARKTVINTLVETNGFKKTVVQSYASNFRKN